jgi:phosphatidylglycerophosphate synthase
MLNHSESFAGDKKVGLSLLGAWEKKLVNKYVNKIPKSIETYHLTLTTILWSALIVLFGFLAQYNIHWMWGVSIMILFQYLTDLFDGAVGRFRNTGLIRWGYYMDHFLDYIFLCSILIGYSFILNDEFNSLFFILVAFGAFMVNSYLAFAATNEFKIEYLKIGPTEVRLIFIIINTLLIFFHKTYLAPLLPYVLALSIIGLCFAVYETQKIIWKKDMEIKQKNL